MNHYFKGSPAVGQRLTDNFNVDITITGMAVGGMGVVVWGPDSLLDGQWRAVKFLRPDMDTEAARDAFVKEAIIWAHLWPHANILPTTGLHHFDVLGGAPGLLLPYAVGGSLRNWLRTGRAANIPYNLRFAVAAAQQIALGLAAIHTPDPSHERPFPLVHCDLKPENVLVTGDGYLSAAAASGHGTANDALRVRPGNVSLSDFGLARILSTYGTSMKAGEHEQNVRLSHNVFAGTLQPFTYGGVDTLSRRIENLAHEDRGPIVGTYPYMPPEQWAGIEATEPASDIYALGVMLFEMFSGSVGWPRSGVEPTARAWRDAHLHGPTRTLSTVAGEALSQGPLAEIRAAPGTGAAELANIALRQLDSLVLVCLERNAHVRPLARDLVVALGDFAESLGIRREPSGDAWPRIPANEAMYWTNLGQTYADLGRPDKRLACIKKVVELCPADAVHWCNLGNALSSLGGYDQARDAFRQAESLITNDQMLRGELIAAGVPYGTGTNALLQERPDEAVAAFEQALARNPLFAPAWQGLAAAYGMYFNNASTHESKQRYLYLALGYADCALRLDPDNVGLRTMRASMDAQFRLLG